MVSIDKQLEEEYNKIDEIGNMYKTIPFKKTGASKNREDRPYMFYPILVKNCEISLPSKTEIDLLYQNKIFNDNNLNMLSKKYTENRYEFILPRDKNNKFLRWTSGVDTCLKLIKENKLEYANGTISQRKYPSEIELIEQSCYGTPKNFVYKKDFANGTLELKEFEIPFDNPKSTALLTYLTKLIINNNKITILDFFSGSATTAHAVMKLNAEDGGNRKFIMVQLPELTYTIKNGKEVPNKGSEEAYKAGYKNICEIGKERIRRAGKQIQEENPDKNIDIGFKVFRVGETTLNWEHKNLQGEDIIHTYKADTSKKDMLDFTPTFTDKDVVYEIMLRQEGLPLSSKIEKLTDIGERTYYIANSLIVCLEETITKEILEKLAAITPVDKFIFRDSAFGDDISLKSETFNRLSSLIDKNSNKKNTYKVEFI